MKQILIDLDDRSARDLERVAPAKQRKRADFIRLAIRRAVDLALDRETEKAYRDRPVSNEVTPEDLAGWDEHNLLASRPAKAKAQRPRRRRETAA